MCFKKNKKESSAFAKNISTYLFDSFPPASLLYFIWLSPIRFKVHELWFILLYTLFGSQSLRRTS